MVGWVAWTKNMVLVIRSVTHIAPPYTVFLPKSILLSNEPIHKAAEWGCGGLCFFPQKS